VFHRRHNHLYELLKLYSKVFVALIACSGENSAEIIARLKRDLVPTMINGVMYWPVCDFVTFKFIPVHLQVQVGSLL
jgi:protein Mpv17